MSNVLAQQFSISSARLERRHRRRSVRKTNVMAGRESGMIVVMTDRTN